MYPLLESDLDGYPRGSVKRGILERRMLGGDSARGGLGGRDGRHTDTREKTGSVLIERQEATVPSAEPDLSSPERGQGAPLTLPAHPCGRARHGVFCRKPRGHSGRCDL